MGNYKSNGKESILTKYSLAVIVIVVTVLMFIVTPVMAVPGDTIITPVTPMELPIEVEIELSPAASLKQAPLWKELVQMLENPYEPVERRPSFTATPLPELNVYPLGYNFLTAQPLRLRTSDGEISWDQPGPLFDPDEIVAIDAFNTPTELRTVIGLLVAAPNDPPYEAADIPAAWFDDKPSGSLVVYNPDGHPAIPPDGTVVAVTAYFDGMLHELDPATGDLEPLAELEMPVNEEHFFRDPCDVAGVPEPLLPLIGRPAAEILGKALFWDMQIGSDGVQACGSCHFHAGVDNRTRNQLNPNDKGGDLTLQVRQPTENVVTSDFPFHKLNDPTISGEPLKNPENVLSDANDVMSSMGVIFRTFVDIPTPGPGAFGPAFNGVTPLLPDIGIADPDPIPAFQGFRRVESRNTPTFHGAAFNLDNFWDGRARFNFNGGSVFGPSDPYFHIYVNDGTPSGAMHGLPDPSEETIELSLYEWAPEPNEDPVPARIKFSSLASQAMGPPLSEFEMSFIGRNWGKIGKKLLQANVVPLANQLVGPNDSVLGPFSNQNITPGMPGLSISYPELIQSAFSPNLWSNTTQHLNGTPDANDPFDGYALSIDANEADPVNTNQFTQIEANFSLLFGLSVQVYESLTIPDDTPADKFFDANPLAGHAVGEPGDQAVLFPTLIPDLLDDGLLNGTFAGTVTLIPDDPDTPYYDGFGPDEVFGFDLFAGSNLTAALSEDQAVDPVSGINRNPVHIIMVPFGADPADQQELEIKSGSNPFTRSAKCMLCHLGPEQTDASINIAHGLLKNNAEFEYPTPPFATDPATATITGGIFGDGLVPAPEPAGQSKAVGGLILAEEVTEGQPQDAVEVEPRNFATFEDLATSWDDTIIAQPGNFAFGDQGIYNIGVRPNAEDIGRGDDDPFGWPLALAALTLKNIGGQDFEPADGPGDISVMANFDPFDIEATFEETGDGAFFPGTTYTLQSINPGFERGPIDPQLPDYMAPWINDLPAGELHPQIDEMAGMLPNTLTPPNGGPAIEFPEILFGADLHCAQYNPAIFGLGPPNFGWGSPLQTEGPSLCPQNQSGVAGNFDFPVHGTWPVANRVLRDGAFKAPPLRNIELTGPMFHTGSYLTLRQVIDFYFRGGDFPVANAESRDPHIVELDKQAFAFGRTTGADLAVPINHVFSIDPPFTLEGSFADGLPDIVYLYTEYPDSNHPTTPELTFPGATPAEQREAALEDAKTVLVKFLLALTDPRVKFEQAPFDRPEIFVPIDGTAPDNTGGRAAFLADARFRHIPAVGAEGRADPLPNFLQISSTPVPGPDNDHHDAQNLAPIAVDDAFTVTAEVLLLVNGMLDNDTDAPDQPLTAILQTPPSPNSTLILNPDGSFMYRYTKNVVPAPFVDTFTYVATDGSLSSSPATVTITVNPLLAPLSPFEDGILRRINRLERGLAQELARAKSRKKVISEIERTIKRLAEGLGAALQFSSVKSQKLVVRLVNRKNRREVSLAEELARAKSKRRVVNRRQRLLDNTNEVLAVAMQFGNFKDQLKAVRLAQTINRNEARLVAELARAKPRQARINKYQRRIDTFQATLDILLG